MTTAFEFSVERPKPEALDQYGVSVAGNLVFVAVEHTSDGPAILAVQMGPAWFWTPELWAGAEFSPQPPFLAALYEALDVKLTQEMVEAKIARRMDALEAA